MNAPRLNRALVLEAPMRGSDGAGGHVQGWTALGTLWAEVSLRTGRASHEAGVPTGRMAYKIVVRGAPVGAQERPVPGQRFRDGARIFSIEAVAERDPEGRYLSCFAQEEVGL
ncbi:head-tail adaptor protein [Sulfitobacter aestuarii]|uniref:Head-tail adaptor protein n=1 Tax=Sulfitobacter aestuarii TaxID=2161676 RepID=A0ABW5U1W5_9RHOB